MSPTRSRLFGLVAGSFVGLISTIAPGCHGRPPETLGFVLSDWRQELPRIHPGHCPDGPNPTEFEFHGVSMPTFRRDMVEMGWPAAVRKHLPPDACTDPSAQEDPGHLTMEAPLGSGGLDLDGHSSLPTDELRCAHRDFFDDEMRLGIDNQLARVLGCSRGYFSQNFLNRSQRSPADARPFSEQGSAILIEIADVEDRRNDDEVRVRIVSSPDPIRRASNGSPLPYASLSEHPVERYRSRWAAGTIADGRLQTEPLDLRLRYRNAVVDDEVVWLDARIDAVLHEDGQMTGTIGYFWEAENLFRILNGHQIDGQPTGRLAAHSRGYMCAGLYRALWRAADGHFDPERGHCTSLSAAHWFEAIPAFVISASDTEADGLLPGPTSG